MYSVLRSTLVRLVPSGLRHRYRTWRYQRSRVNAVVLVDRGRVGRWLRATPDTYRVAIRPESNDVPTHDQIGADSGEHAVLAVGDDSRAASLAVSALHVGAAECAVVGEIGEPPPIGGGRFEPQVDRIAALAITRETYEKVSECGFQRTPGDLYRGARDSGAHLALVPGRGGSTQTRELEAPVFVVVSAVPMHDIGGGSRGAQLAVGLVEAGVTVVYLSVFPSFDSVDVGVRFAHPNLHQHTLGEMDAERLLQDSRSPGWVIVELPEPTSAGLATRLKRDGWKVCYDIIDRWADPALGSDWYSPGVEHRLIDEADLVTVSAQDLAVVPAERGVEALLIPNAVNSRVFGAVGSLDAPGDFPAGEGPVFGYHGSLYGDWFDWAGLISVASAHPDARVVVIGEAPKGHPRLPENIHLLGQKPIEELPAYLRRFDVGLLPFVVSDTTHAVSPLKVYEYLASGVPVAAPPLRSLEGLDGIHTATDFGEAVGKALVSGPPDPDEALAEHTWAQRARMLLEATGTTPRDPGSAVCVSRRSAEHYDKGERQLSW